MVRVADMELKIPGSIQGLTFFAHAKKICACAYSYFLCNFDASVDACVEFAKNLQTLIMGAISTHRVLT